MSHWETGKADVSDNSQARRPAVMIVTNPAGEQTGGTENSVCGGAGICHAMENRGDHYPY
jgi:hypothetical protein